MKGSIGKYSHEFLTSEKTLNLKKIFLCAIILFSDLVKTESFLCERTFDAERSKTSWFDRTAWLASTVEDPI